MRPIRSVSVLMPTFQGREFLGRALRALAEQRLDLPWDFRAIDSGSTDGTLELLAAAREGFPVPVAVERIDPVEFDHGDTRNLLAARSEGDLLVFLTQDAIPSGADWLAGLVANFEDEQVGAAYCRNVPRADAHALTRLFSAADPGYAPERRETRLPAADVYAGMNPHERRLLYGFNDVASAVRRELWERHPFPRTSFGEDVLLARALLEAGFTVVYDGESTVEHSHDFDEGETFLRAQIDGRFNAEWLDRVCIASEKDAATLTGRLSAEDESAIDELDGDEDGRRDLRARARRLRSATFRGLHEGGRSERRFAPTRLLDRGELSILYVVHGFPPDTWAGTEIYTYNLALELQRRGHRCTIFARTPRGEGQEDFELQEEEFQGLRVLRMTHGLEHASLRESFLQPRAEAVFRSVLEAERPNLVHFQHLIHTSVGLVDVARSFDLPTVVTCHDYWAICPRVQLIRPDGQICAQPMGSGCYLCVKERGLAHVERARRLDAGAAGVLAGLAGEIASGADVPEGLRRRARDYMYLKEREEVVPAAYAACDLRISPSRFLRDKLLESGHFDPHTFLYSDNGMRTDHIQALAKSPDPEGRVRFGFVGSLVWYKGGEVLVRAMNRLAGTRAVLNVFGDFQPEEDEHHAALAALAAADNVSFRGRFDNARLSEVYAEIDVLVVPSVWYENSPITIHEALLTRTPMLASDLGGMAEYVRDGVDGLRFRVGDDEDLARAMRRFLDEPDLMERLAGGPGQGPAVKTIAENAAEMEFRYRGLACRGGASRVARAGGRG